MMTLDESLDEKLPVLYMNENNYCTITTSSNFRD
jgi:hypothetical protein